MIFSQSILLENLHDEKVLNRRKIYNRLIFIAVSKFYLTLVSMLILVRHRK